MFDENRIGHLQVINIKNQLLETKLQDESDEVYQIHIVNNDTFFSDRVNFKKRPDSDWNDCSGFLVTTFIKNEEEQISVALPLTQSEYNAFEELKKIFESIAGCELNSIDGSLFSSAIHINDEIYRLYYSNLLQISDTINNMSKCLILPGLLNSLPEFYLTERTIIFPQIGRPDNIRRSIKGWSEVFATLNAESIQPSINTLPLEI